MGEVIELFEDYEEDVANEIHLTEPQTQLMLTDVKFPLFVAGFGSGKSQAMVVNALNDLFNFKGANVALYAPTYDLLKLIVMQYVEEILTNGNFDFKLNSSEHIFYVTGYGKIICRSMDNAGRIVGYETFRGHCDEMDILGEAKARMAWQKIIARNRQKIYKLDEYGRRIPQIDSTGDFVFLNGRQQFKTEMNKVSAYTTPEGFGFAYKRWVKEDDPKGHYKMVRATTYSNEHNLPEDYIETLRASYPAELIDAYLLGKFVNLTSGQVYRRFDRILNSSKESVKNSEHIHVGMDFNIEHGAAVIHVLRNGDQEAHAVDEIFDSYDTDDTIRILNERYPNNLITIYPDATGVKRSSSNGAPTATDISKLRIAGYNIEVDYSNPLIKDRVNCVNARILNGLDERKYFVAIDACPNTVETLESQAWDGNGVPDKKSGLDHIGDALGYFVAKVFPIVRQNAGFIRTTSRIR